MKQILSRSPLESQNCENFRDAGCEFCNGMFPAFGGCGCEKETITAVESPRVIAVFSRDASIVKIIAEGISDSWVMEKFADAHEARAFPLKPSVRIVVIDDEAIEESTRGWLLDQVHERAPTLWSFTSRRFTVPRLNGATVHIASTT